jgi:hypothetical protein
MLTKIGFGLLLFGAFCFLIWIIVSDYLRIKKERQDIFRHIRSRKRVIKL